jgi:hypothetical protein
VSAKYLLPCRCGEKFVVEPVKAGETIACPCGASLQVPTMLEMSRLEIAPEESIPSSASSGWSVRQGVLVVGITLLVAAAVSLAVIVSRYRPIPPADLIDPDLIGQSAQRLSPVHTWQTFQQFKQGLGRVDLNYADALTLYHGLLAFPAIFALLGLGSIVAFYTSAPRPKPSEQTKQA